MDTAAALAPIGHNQPPPLKAILAENHKGLSAEIEALAAKANAAPNDITDGASLGLVGDIVKAARQLGRKVDDIRKTEKDPHLTAGREVDAFFGVMLDRITRVADTLDARATAYQSARAAEERRAREAAAAAARAEELRQREIAARAEEANRSKTAARHQAKADVAAETATIAEQAATAKPADMTRIHSSDGTVVSAKVNWSFEIIEFGKVDLEALRPYLPRADVEKAIRSFVRVHKDATPLAGVRIFEEVKASYR